MFKDLLERTLLKGQLAAAASRNLQLNYSLPYL